MITTNKKTIAIMIMAIALYYMITMFLGLDLCLFKNTTGIPCPGCGLTRASVDILHFRWSEAMIHHALVLPVWLLLIVFLFKKFNQRSVKVLFLFAVVFIGYYIVRMVLYFPHQVPMDFNPEAIIPKLFNLLFKK